MNTIKIPNKSIIEDFKEHLDLGLNQRILFTAPFGAGKSTFINEFQEEHNKEYRFIRLYPVNYAVSANEDVFELIKFDILYELMAHYKEEINLQKEDFDFWLRMSMFMQNKADLMPLFLHIISLHETIGKPIAKFIEVIKPLVNDFKTYTKEININESDDVFSFLETFKNKKGSQYEMDATSQFIYDLVDRLKGVILPEQEEIQEKDKKRVNKTVLVIDDLDRLDPDHIFRLFNIFSAHTHSINGENKFGFDKVVFVCDIENIQRIYSHKYGRGVDFSGYMDKFYSLKPFEFDHKEHLTNKLIHIIDGYNFTGVDTDFKRAEYFKSLLIGVLKVMIGERIINLRSLLQVGNITIDLRAKQNSKFSNWILPGVAVFRVLKELLGSSSVLNKSLNTIELSKKNFSHITAKQYNNKYKYNLSHYEFISITNAFIVFHDDKLIHNNELSWGGEKKIYFEELGLTLFYQDTTYDYTKKIECSGIYLGNCTDKESESKVELSIPNLMLHAFNYLKENHEL